MTRTEAYEWFNATDRKDWNDWSIEAAQEEIDNWQNPDAEPGTAEELYEMMKEIIDEYDELNEEPYSWGGAREGSGRPATGRKKKSFYITDEENEALRKHLEELRQ